jgi:hypothetical protein
MAFKTRAKKLFLTVVDERFLQNRQLSIVNLITNGRDILSNSYGKVYSQNEIGDFDIIQSEPGKANLTFYPLDGRINDYSYSYTSYDIEQTITEGKTIQIGDIVSVASTNITVSSYSNANIFSLNNDYTSSKLIIQLSDQFNEYFEYNEINISSINGEASYNRYGTLTIGENEFPSGIGEYNLVINGPETVLKYNSPFTDRSVNINVVSVSFANTSFNQSGEVQLRHSLLDSNKVSIASTSLPVPEVISSYPLEYNSAYFAVQVTDKTNDIIDFSEFTVVTNENQSIFSKYGTIQSQSTSLGSFEINTTINGTEILFTPIPDIDVDIITYKNSFTLAEYSDYPKSKSFENFEIRSGISRFNYSDEQNYRVNFDLTHDGISIFERQFDPQNQNILNITDDFISIPNHFFVTGEKIKYRTDEFLYNSENAIGISQTSILGVGLTTILPEEVFVYKVDDVRIRLCSSPEIALSNIPSFIQFTNSGIGQTHYLTSTDPNKKCIITIDNVIQTPVVSTLSTCFLENDLNFASSILKFSSIESFSIEDLIIVNDEIMKIVSIGIGSTNSVQVKRPWMGTKTGIHSSGDLITKMTGNYNIINNTIYFSSAPYGKKQRPSEYNFSDSSLPEYETKSSFHGRVFIRSGVPLESFDTYSTNNIFDDISSSFNAITKRYELTNSGNSVTGIEDQNSLLLINNILQVPEKDFNFTEISNKTYIDFTGTATSISYDPNNASVPKGGIIVSAGSSNGYGLQPLVAAGGTAIVSISGTIQSITINNNGAGYRSGIQTNIRVGVQTYSSGIPNIEYIGTATVSNGRIISININGSTPKYSTENPPEVIIDPPLAYYNIPLKYSTSSVSGIGTEATVDIIVGQGSSVVNYKLNNFGYGYKKGEILTFNVGGSSGIPLDSTKPYKEFSLIIDKVYSDSFYSWNIGELEIFDDISNQFNGNKKTFRLLLDGNRYAILKRPGTRVDLKATLIILINGVIQIPNESYIFEGGSTITFVEPPKEGDRCDIIFYKGTEGIDVKLVNILETVKVGDNLNIYSEQRNLTEKKRIVSEIPVPDLVQTIDYLGKGITQEQELLRPVNWCKQRNDIVIDDTHITKDRIEYEPSIHPIAKLISNVSIGSTLVWVDNIRPLFDYKNENADREYTNKIEIIGNLNSKPASATVTVSTSGTISSVNLIDGGIGYKSNPKVSISDPYYTKNGIKSSLQSSISNVGIVTNITIANPGFGYTNSNPPIILIEPPKVIKESVSDVNYYGDFGIISGIKQTSIPNAPYGLVLDLLIPSNSILRDPDYFNPNISISEIQNNYYFTVYGSTIGDGTTSLDKNGNVIGIGTKGIDNIYQAISVSIGTTSAFGMGQATVAKVTVSVSNYNGIVGFGFSNFYGNYSWGLIEIEKGISNSFTINNDYNSQTNPFIKRANQLKYVDYTLI